MIRLGHITFTQYIQVVHVVHVVHAQNNKVSTLRLMYTHRSQKLVNKRRGEYSQIIICNMNLSPII